MPLHIGFTYETNTARHGSPSVRFMPSGVVELWRERAMYPKLEITHTNHEQEMEAIGSNYLLFSVVYDDGRELCKCPRCPDEHVLGFKRKQPPQKIVEYGTPVSGFVSHPNTIENTTHFNPASFQSHTHAPHQGGSDGEAYPVVRYRDLKTEGVRHFKAFLACNSHFHGHHLFHIKAQLVFLNEAGEVIGTEIAYSPRIKVVSKFLNKKGTQALAVEEVQDLMAISSLRKKRKLDDSGLYAAGHAPEFNPAVSGSPSMLVNYGATIGGGPSGSPVATGGYSSNPPTPGSASAAAAAASAAASGSRSASASPSTGSLVYNGSSSLDADQRRLAAFPSLEQQYQAYFYQQQAAQANQFGQAGAVAGSGGIYAAGPMGGYVLAAPPKFMAGTVAGATGLEPNGFSAGGSATNLVSPGGLSATSAADTLMSDESLVPNCDSPNGPTAADMYYASLTAGSATTGGLAPKAGQLSSTAFGVFDTPMLSSPNASQASDFGPQGIPQSPSVMSSTYDANPTVEGVVDSFSRLQSGDKLSVLQAICSSPAEWQAVKKFVIEQAQSIASLDYDSE